MYVFHLIIIIAFQYARLRNTDYFSSLDVNKSIRRLKQPKVSKALEGTFAASE